MDQPVLHDASFKSMDRLWFAPRSNIPIFTNDVLNEIKINHAKLI